MKRIVLIVLDSVGMGELPDAAVYGDVGSNTLGNISAVMGGLRLPNLESLGLGNIDNMKGYNKYESPFGCYGRMAEKSFGKDTTTGHWEISGLILDKAFPVYPSGFPKEIIDEFEKRIGLKTIGNFAASGTEIINMLGKEHVETGYPIVYTSADSVFQIAAHEDVVPVERLYEICSIARALLTGEHAVGRVIARPFTGVPGSFKRTDRRRDFSLKPLRKTVLDYAKEEGFMVKAVGKIEDIFGGQGITHAVHTHDNMDGVSKTLQYMDESFEGIIFTNLVDFDMVYGHRNDAAGYAKALKEFDQKLPDIMGRLKDEDILIITADHGCDPTFRGTDHTREYVPLLVYGKCVKNNVNLGTRNTFSDIAATISEYLGLNAKVPGESFLADIIGGK
ncbi:MAG TPA: phosphopentomutase [Pseudobacteroides sp.]|nr:phosphopentomutase [Pseudobacteroides sp.]